MWEIVTLGSTPYPGIAAADVMRKVSDHVHFIDESRNFSPSQAEKKKQKIKIKYKRRKLESVGTKSATFQFVAIGMKRCAKVNAKLCHFSQRQNYIVSGASIVFFLSHFFTHPGCILYLDLL